VSTSEGLATIIASFECEVVVTMSDVQKYLLSVSNDRVAALGFAQDTARGMPGDMLPFTQKPDCDLGLESKESTLIDVVQSLGEYINDEDATIRSRAIDYLSQVIGHLSTAFLSRQQIQVLCQFLCDRIEDGGAVGGLRKLAALERFNKEMASLTFRA